MNSKKIFNNSVIGIIQLIFVAGITLISVPIFINKLGLELYGIFAVVSVIGNLNLLTNFGLNGALMVYVAKQGKSLESDKDIIVTQIIILIIIILFIGFAHFLREYIILSVFAIPIQHIDESEKLYTWLIFSNAILLLGQSYTAVIDAQQKIYLTNISQFIYSVIYWVGLITIVYSGGNLSGVGITAFIAASVWFAIVFCIYRKLWGKLNISGLNKQFKSIAYKQLKFGSKIYLSGLIGFMFEPLSKVLLSNLVGLNVVALFEIGTKIRGQINGLITKGLYPFYPYIAQTTISENLHKRLFDLSKKILLIVLPVCLVMSFVISYLVQIWLGTESNQATSIFVITLTASLLIFSPPILPIYQYLSAKNKADKNVLIQLSSVIVNAIIFFTFYRILGIYTILLSNSLAYFASFLIGNYYQFKYFGADFWKERYFYLKLIGFGIGCTLLCLLIRLFVPIGIWDLVIYPALVGTVFLYFVRRFQLITINDIDTYFGYIPFIKVRLIKLFIN
jgi:O-antigen/teichoic acid export membrane protein